MSEDVFDYLTQRGVPSYVRALFLGIYRPAWMTVDMADRLIRLVDTVKTTPELLPNANAEGARRAGLYAVGRKGVAVLCGRSVAG